MSRFILAPAWCIASRSGSTRFLLYANIPVYGCEILEISAVILDIAQKMRLEFDGHWLPGPGSQVQVKTFEGLLSQGSVFG